MKKNQKGFIKTIILITGICFIALTANSSFAQVFLKKKLYKINSCTTISTPGNYILSKNIINIDQKPCISIKNTKNVTLSCNSNTIFSKNENQGLYIENVSNFEVNNCKLVSESLVPVEVSTQNMLQIESSKWGELKNITLGGNFNNFRNSSFITLRDSVVKSQLNVYRSNNITLKNNSFSNTSDNITLQEGYNNSIISNNIDGQSDGVFNGVNNSIGADDGIVIKDEKGDLIKDNDIKNFFDCAVENIGYMFNTKIVDNKVTNTGVCFLGGWYSSSVKDVLVKNNVVNNSPNLFYFSRIYPLKQNEKKVYFQNNIFEKNKLTNPKLNTSYSVGSRFVFTESDVLMKDYIFGNNILKNNDFTKNTNKIYVFPKGIIQDGGGNICSGVEEEAKGGGDAIPFNCN